MLGAVRRKGRNEAMATILEAVDRALNLEGFHTGLANPGQWIPEIEEPVVAICLEQVDSDAYEVTVRAEVVSPVALGGQRCEEDVLRVVHTLQNVGARCRVTSLRFDAKTELFSMAVLATFYGDILDERWVAGTACNVVWGGKWVGEPVSFTAWRETSDPDTEALAETKWHFRMEEVLDGKYEEAAATAGFTISVTAGNIQESYTGCTVTSQQRVLRGGYLRQIREGIAQKKEA